MRQEDENSSHEKAKALEALRREQETFQVSDFRYRDIQLILNYSDQMSAFGLNRMAFELNRVPIEEVRVYDMLNPAFAGLNMFGLFGCQVKKGFESTRQGLEDLGFSGGCRFENGWVFTYSE